MCKVPEATGSNIENCESGSGDKFNTKTLKKMGLRPNLLKFVFVLELPRSHNLLAFGDQIRKVILNVAANPYFW